MNALETKMSALQISCVPCFQAFELMACKRCVVVRWTNRKKLCFVCHFISKGNVSERKRLSAASALDRHKT
jgi:hypothetical protein